MKEPMQWILVYFWTLGLTKAYHFQNEIVEPLLNYNGAKRSHCPAIAHKQPANRQDTSLRLRQLRSEMTRVASIQGPPLDGYIVTSDDAHQSDSLDPRDMRREFITGFYGSAGEAVITLNKAVFWTDGRYYIQADHQLDCNWILMKRGREDVPSITEWLIHEFHNQALVRIGADPTLVSAIDWEIWEDELANSSIRLVPVRNNLVDLIWQVNRPNYNPHPAYPLPDKYSGRAWQDKIQSIRIEMEVSKANALVLTALDEIAWLFNVRGYDLPHTPVLRAYAIITGESIHLYTPRHKILRSVEEHLKMDFCSHANCVKWHNYTSIWYDLRTMSQAWNSVWLPTRCGYSPGASMEIFNSIPPEKRLPKPSPVLSLRAQKNEIEAEGMRRSHLRDAVAMCDFLAYMEWQYELNSDGWDEMQVARLANEFRYEQEKNKGISFPTIAGYGPHAAIPHYEPNNLTNIKIGRTSTLVVDSGGQYLDGTTDVTRTLHFGTPTEEQKKAYTRVLIGAIQLSSLIFPSNLKSNQLDIVAREPLWNIGYDYLHGTGHGIGHFLSVHESPIGISYAHVTTSDKVCGPIELKPGFFLSNEPGYYKQGDFGIRLENVLETVVAGKKGSEIFLKFRDITLVPYEPKLIDNNMLNPSHIRWLNNYNRRIRDEIGAELKKRLRMDAFDWMMKKTATIPEIRRIDEKLLFNYSHSTSSIFKKFHVLIYFISIYHILFNLPDVWS
ncbi:xaa-Pro aminopeptidase 1 isoform X2 [Apis cerana]|uniref:xaa-Pro aminopeptidase 1 isoform X2 n=1 Tax=Apis cerana TaxID=7461 RepID=UPI0007E2D158|nr:xaa-Pro aminopeptidase 1 isoform X2 [Apis cerana]XP_061929844.1 xaa-Pro aminopeptidase 1 isoform X2 [Apis cerana]XP_061929845.1 xaa-Pro aminopeptidase 1 isoform X2 [Apis cerana]XP_061929846.1 xaa-Pro aminopeptidase 1 isoform X2 [Apis cerana]XP_061929847.1 xaa-Pro aminopeptidase 1 isoform X2 [Apis cerana]